MFRSKFIISALLLLISIVTIVAHVQERDAYTPVIRKAGVEGEWINFWRDTISLVKFHKDGTYTETSYKPTGKNQRYKKETTKVVYEVSGTHMTLADSEYKLGFSIRFASNGQDTILAATYDWLPICTDTSFLMNDKYRELIKRLDELSE